jgi:hypothetical protein
MIIGVRSIPERATLLTFDDGWGSLWTYGYPLLKKYGMHGVCFIIPGMINEGINSFPNLSDVWEKRVSNSGLIERERSQEPLCTWAEIKDMANSGVIDFQSHTMYHSLIFTSPHIIDFFHPSFDSYIKNLNVPIFQSCGQDNIERKAEWGMPIYAYAPRMAGKRRYFGDEKLQAQCVEFVRENGGRDFFNKQQWRKHLRQYIADYRIRGGENGHYESLAEQRDSISWDFLESKRLIEEKLPGKKIQHFCYPFFVGSEVAVMLSKEAGFLCNFWGFLHDRRSNRTGDDPYHIVRLVDEIIFRLPGRGRIPLWKILGHRIVKDSLQLFDNLKSIATCR